MDTWEYVARTSRNGDWPSGCASVRSPEIQISIIILKRTSAVSVMRTELGDVFFSGEMARVQRGRLFSNERSIVFSYVPTRNR